MEPVKKLHVVADLVQAKSAVLNNDYGNKLPSNLEARIISDRAILTGKKFSEMSISELASFDFLPESAKNLLANRTYAQLCSELGIPFSSTSKKFEALELLVRMADGHGTSSKTSLTKVKTAIDIYRKFALRRGLPFGKKSLDYSAAVSKSTKVVRKAENEQAALLLEENRKIIVKQLEEYFEKQREALADLIEQTFGPNYEPHGEMLPNSIKSIKRDPAMDHEAADGKRGNPYFDYNLKTYSNNCQTCVVVYEMRRRGYDVQATGWAPDIHNPCEIVSYCYTLPWIDPKTGKQPVPMSDPSVQNVKSCLNWMNRVIETGARYTFAVCWRGRRYGHVVTAYKNDEEKVVIFDPQVGELYETDDEINDFMSNVSFAEGVDSPQLLRCDNLLLNVPLIKKLVKKKDGIEPY